MIRSNILRRALVTASSRTIVKTAKPFTPATTAHPQITFYKPTLTSRHFKTTAIMPGSHDRVHNLPAKKDFDAALAEKDTLMILDCFATWCGPCKVIAPKVAEFSEKYTDAKFYQIDVDEVPDVARELGIRAMPTFLLFKNGERVGEVVGANPKALEAAITGHLNG